MVELMVWWREENMILKVCFLGMGSIGTRHLRNLSKICREKGIKLRTTAFRTGKTVLQDDVRRLIDREIRSIDDIRGRFDIAFVTNPTACHYQTICQFKEYTKHLFIEKPIFENSTYALEDILPPRGSVYYVAAPMRFTDVFLKTKEFVRTHKVYSSRIICSSYMPEWQKGRDYTESFRTKKALGGGVDIDLIHEIDYMTDLFGMPQNVVRLTGKYSELEMDACDLATYIFEYDTCLVEMHLDYFGRVDNRKIELYYENGIYVGDYIKKCSYIKYHNHLKEYPEDVDHYYREMEYFLRLITEPEHMRNINTVENAYKVLKLAKGEL